MNRDLEKAIWWMLKEIDALVKKNNVALFRYVHTTNIDQDEQRRALMWLEKEGALNIRHSFHDNTFLSSSLKSLMKLPEDGFYILKEEPSFTEKYIEYEKKFQKNVDSKKLRLPATAKWEDITITCDDKYTINIYHNNKYIETLDYKEMGLFDKRTQQPNKQWATLMRFIIGEGEIEWSRGNPIKNGRIAINRLSEELKRYFGISENPFYPYKEFRCYKSKFFVTDESKMKQEYEDAFNNNEDDKNNDDMGVEEFLAEHGKSVFVDEDKYTD